MAYRALFYILLRLKMKTIRAILFLSMIIIIGCNSNSNEREWSSFRGNNQNTGYYNGKAPTELTELKWKFEIERKLYKTTISTSTAISNGMVFFGSTDYNLYAVDIKTGQEKWKFE